jgi:hypothetical protein
MLFLSKNEGNSLCPQRPDSVEDEAREAQIVTV